MIHLKFLSFKNFSFKIYFKKISSIFKPFFTAKTLLVQFEKKLRFNLVKNQA